MKTLKLEVTDKLAEQIERLVQAGWFASGDELARLALSEFLSHHRFELQEQFQREDIRWAMGLKAGER
ncbi:MAG TPA: CopG family transcriptional regulator [Thermoanaerobaculia bacterium]|jgi:Arc/MetJ-type ribon-helix-helix transcriptional regulator